MKTKVNFFALLESFLVASLAAVAFKAQSFHGQQGYGMVPVKPEKQLAEARTSLNTARWTLNHLLLQP